MNGTLERYINAADIATLNTAGETYTNAAENIILSGERGEFRTEADADMYIMNATADLIAKAEKFLAKIIADKPSRRQPSRGIVIARRRDGRFAVMAYTAFTNDGRAYAAPAVLDTEDEARNLANGLWTYNGF